MMTSIFRKACSAALLTASIAFTAYGISTTANAADKSDTRIVVGQRAVPETLDPAHASNANNDFYIAALYDRIVTYSKTGELQPFVAKEWKYSDDAKSIELKLRDDIVFHSGNKLTAKDVAYSLDRLIAIGAGTGGLITDYERSEIKGDHELVLHLKRPNLSLLGALALVYVVDSELVAPNEGADKGQKWLSSNDAGSGAYRLKSYNPNQQVAYTRVDDHWTARQGRPADLVVRIITDSSAIRDEVRAGGINLGAGVPAIDLKAFEEDPKFTVQRLPSTRITLGVMNMGGKVTGDPRVREAIQLAYDLNGHVKAALGGYGTIATSLVPASMACRVAVEPAKVDIERATKLVAEAGAAGATLRIAYQPVIPEQRVGGTLLEATLRKIGFNVEVVPVTFSQYLNLIKSPDTVPDIAILWDFAPYPSIGQTLWRTWSSDAIGVSNFARYSNKDVDRLLAEGRAATDPKVACKSFEEAQKLIIQDRPTLLIAFPEIPEVYDKTVAELPVTPVAAVFDLSLVTVAE